MSAWWRQKWCYYGTGAHLTLVTGSLRGARWANHSLDKAYEIFSKKKDSLGDFWSIFLENKKIFMKGCQNSWSWIPLRILHMIFGLFEFWAQGPRTLSDWNASAEQGWCQGRARGATAPPSETLKPPVGGNYGFSSEELWQYNAWKRHFSVILASLSEAPAPLSESFWRHPWSWIPCNLSLTHCCNYNNITQSVPYTSGKIFIIRPIVS